MCADFGEDLPGLVVRGVEHEVHRAAGHAPAVPWNRAGSSVMGVRAEDTGDDGLRLLRIRYRHANLVHAPAGLGAGRNHDPTSTSEFPTASPSLLPEAAARHATQRLSSPVNKASGAQDQSLCARLHASASTGRADT